MSEAASTYEALPYTNHAFATTHPDILATAARLHGLHPAPLATCRVLELGCGRGANLLSMALQFPEGRFVGIDLSPRQIADGQSLAQTLHLTNVELRPLSILDVDERLGTFDYVICHGVFSWVSREVQEQILHICASRLAANGVAFVSYNTYPGWHLRGMVGDLLRYHAAEFPDPLTQAQQARAFLDFLVKTARVPDGNYGRVLKQEQEVLEESFDTYLFHEHLEGQNAPLYFHQFMARAASHRLQFLAEAEPSSLTGDLPPPLEQMLRQLAPDRLAYEQHLDFLAGTQFRRSLLCHAAVPLLATPDVEVVPTLRVRARLRPVEEDADVDSTATVQFRSARGVIASTNNPLAKATFTLLFEPWPKGLSFDDLWSRVHARLNGTGRGVPPELDLSRGHLARLLLQYQRSGLVELYSEEAALVTHVSVRPLAGPLSRLLAPTETLVTNLRHRAIKLDDLDRMVLPLLDGSRDAAAVASALAAAVADGSFEIQHQGRPLHDTEGLNAVLEGLVEECLRGLAQNGFLLS